MGVVYTWEEVSAGRIPTEADFRRADQILRADLAGMVERDLIAGALICGSSLRGDFSIRSDVDCLVVPRDPTDQNSAGQLSRLMGRLRGLNIKLQLIVLDSEIASSSMHTISPSFAQHLALSVLSNGVIGQNPLDAVDLSQHDGRENIVSYIGHKLSGLNKGFASLSYYRSEDQQRYVRTLGDFLSTPLHIARMMLWFTRPENPIDSKQEVADAYREKFTFRYDLIRLLDEILALDAGYTDYLRRMIAKEARMSRTQYKRSLREIEETGQRAIEFAQQNALLIHAGWPQPS